MTNDSLNSLRLPMTDNQFIPIRFSKVAHLSCGMAVYDSWASGNTIIKGDGEIDRKTREIREKKDRKTNSSPIICYQ